MSDYRPHQRVEWRAMSGHWHDGYVATEPYPLKGYVYVTCYPPQGSGGPVRTTYVLERDVRPAEPRQSSYRARIWEM